MQIRAVQLLAVLLLVLLSSADVLGAKIEVGGNIFSDTTWTNGDTILVTNQVVVQPDVQLAIQEGAVVMFRPNQRVRVYGELLANGSPGNRVLLTSSADTAGGAPFAGEWFGLEVQFGATIILYSCDLRYAVLAVYSYATLSEFQDCHIENFSTTGLYIYGGLPSEPTTLTVENCVIRQTNPATQGTGNGIYVYRSVLALVTGCKITHCEFGIDLYTHSLEKPIFNISRCEVSHHAKIGIIAHACG